MISLFLYLLLNLASVTVSAKGIDSCVQSRFPELARIHALQATLSGEENPFPRTGLTLTIKGDLKSAQEIIDCVAYPFCGNQVQTLTGDLEGQVEMKLNLELTDSEIAQLPKLCPWKQFRASFDFKARAGLTELFTDLKKSKMDKPSLEAYEQSRVPATLRSGKHLIRTQALKLADKQIEVKHYERASKTLTQAFGFTVKPYQLKFSQNNFIGCITDPILMTVTCSAPENACDLMFYLRHEAEHIQQIARRDFCMNQETGSLFDEHVARERSAYVNDMSNAEQYCPRELVEQIKLNSFETLKKRYWKK